MILEHPKNNFQKINSIKDNSNSKSLSKNLAFLPGLPQNSNNGFDSINNYFPYLINNYAKEDSSSQTQLNNIPNNAIIPVSHPINIKFKINNSGNVSTNSNEDPSYALQNLQKPEIRNNQAKFKIKEN